MGLPRSAGPLNPKALLVPSYFDAEGGYVRQQVGLGPRPPSIIRGEHALDASPGLGLGSGRISHLNPLHSATLFPAPLSSAQPAAVHQFLQPLPRPVLHGSGSVSKLRLASLPSRAISSEDHLVITGSLGTMSMPLNRLGQVPPLGPRKPYTRFYRSQELPSYVGGRRL